MKIYLPFWAKQMEFETVGVSTTKYRESKQLSRLARHQSISKCDVFVEIENVIAVVSVMYRVCTDYELAIQGLRNDKSVQCVNAASDAEDELEKQNSICFHNNSGAIYMHSLWCSVHAMTPHAMQNRWII